MKGTPAVTISSHHRGKPMAAPQPSHAAKATMITTALQAEPSNAVARLATRLKRLCGMPSSSAGWFVRWRYLLSPAVRAEAIHFIWVWI